MNIQDWFPSDWLVWSLSCPRDSQESSPAPQFESIHSFGAQASLVAQTVKNQPAMPETWVLSPWVGKIPWRRERLPTPVFWPGDFHGQRGLVGYSPWGYKESDTTEWLSLSAFFIIQLSHLHKRIRKTKALYISTLNRFHLILTIL